VTGQAPEVLTSGTLFLSALLAAVFAELFAWCRRRPR